MRFIRNLLLLAVVAVVGFYLLESNEISPQETMQTISETVKEKEQLLKTKKVPEERPDIALEGDIFQWYGKSSGQLQEELGEPVRKDPSAYGYTWWVYTNEKDQYIQFGIMDGTIHTIYATGKGTNIKPVAIGESYEKVQKHFTFSEEVNYRNGLASFTFKLNANDRKTRPLVKISDSIFMQLYFDTFQQQLSSVRILDINTLLKHQPYEIQYRGELPKKPSLDDHQWAKIEAGMERQIFDITNIMRQQRDKEKLQWEKSVGEVAFLHSKDMAVNKYFSHSSQDGRGLKERLDEGKVAFVAAGENIAAQYPDAAAAMEGWLNSEGHREALLSEKYTHLGVGVYRLYYTQNFLAKPF
ncbi:CAP domain-containing protein [Virgibacillus pantothenticus]|uniref:Membrane protein n=1 Tax=Virgibacillus pantothenticus TaxID=1473 RepID=A0A0L0QNH1_VIRPA|nr:MULTISPECIES: CAP domain-containing protein [Virgibacillus]API93776.1 hypothetical protein BKP57_19330 [Virgibacillus sp. 6R]KNE20064.1 membrane protein [Virgibacillus pantothenticus]MBS7429809.1 CAP domain-containing protein [Virgibacillus sp. 19R1-5]MBU8565097.1 CAP domain-containing protein [Virgibacillus pantothenticus]MBU8601043.1 CAP domain-containing protein [Virgibacillus pantothenticus]